MNRAFLWTVLVLAFLVPTFPARAQFFAPGQSQTFTLGLDAERTASGVVTVPDGFEPNGLAPVVLVFGAGRNDLTDLVATMGRIDPLARAQGWLVAGLATPTGGQPTAPVMMDVLQIIYLIEAHARAEGRKYHLLGTANGATAALRFALDRPDLIASITLIAPRLTDSELPKLSKLRGIPVRAFVGADDYVEFTDGAKKVVAACQAAGVEAELTIRPAEGNACPGVSAAMLLDWMEPRRRRVGSWTNPQAEVSRTLNALHDAASKAQELLYQDQFAEDAVFIGTDATERWTLEEFHAYFKPLFEKGKGWTYWPVSRNIQIGPGGATAWFDELLNNAKYGLCRGSGVLRREGERWKLVQYNLSFPIPNDLAERVVRLIKSDEARKK